MLVLSESTEGERGEERTHILVRRLLRHALDLRRGRRADRTRARSRRRALWCGRAHDIGATRSRARRALAALLLTRTVVDDHRLLLRDAALQDVLAEVSGRRALGLQHVLAHIGTCGRRRDCALKDILAQVGFSAGRASGARICTAGARAYLFTI